MNDRKHPLHFPLALLATTPRPAVFPLRPSPPELRRLVANMVD
jgi:hypothetical protein